MLDSGTDALLALLLTPGIGHGLAGRLIDSLGSADAAMQASTAQLAQVRGIASVRAGRLRREIDRIVDEGLVAREREAMSERGVQFITHDDAAYPTLLKRIPDPPLGLWVRGGFADADAVGLAIVGARRCTHYGREQADRFAFRAAEAGLTIASGGAYGIDEAAHRAALRAGGRTIAVIGSGLAKPYPREHLPLFDQIAEQGAVVSEFPMFAPPIAENFPRRNRIISGLSLGVLVIEAAARSGALITARLCVEEHGRELMVLPGRVDSKMSEGCHKVIREGWGQLVTNIADVLDQLGETGQLLRDGIDPLPGEGKDAKPDQPSLFERNLSASQQQIVGALDEARSLDQIAAWTGLAMSQVQADLTMLEIRGTVQRHGGLFAKRNGGA